MNTKEIARTLVSITEEQWEAILTTYEHVRDLPIMKELSKALSGDENKAKVEKDEKEFEFKVKNLIKQLGIPPHVLGYTYFYDAIILAYEDESYIHSITTRLYPAIAEKHNATKGRIERALRHALEMSCGEGDPKVREAVFGTNNNPPTNSCAIASMVEYIKMHD